MSLEMWDIVKATEAWGSNNLPPPDFAVVVEIYPNEYENEYLILVKDKDDFKKLVVYEYEIEYIHNIK